MTVVKLTPQQILRRARDLINDNGAHWIKGQLRSKRDGELAYCSLGSINAVCDAPQYNEAYPETRLAVIALANTIREELGEDPVKDIWAAVDTVTGYNDKYDTTWDQIDSVFRRAASAPRRYIERSGFLA